MAYGTRQDTQIHSVYFVLRPTAVSEAIDLVAGGSPRDIAYQFLGGMEWQRVVAMFTDKEEAEARARQEIADRDAVAA